MNYHFARTFRHTPVSQGTGAASVDAFSDRIWRGVGAGEEDDAEPDLGKAAGYGVIAGIIVTTSYMFWGVMFPDSKIGPVYHLQQTLTGMRSKFGASK